MESSRGDFGAKDSPIGLFNDERGGVVAGVFTSVTSLTDSPPFHGEPDPSLEFSLECQRKEILVKVMVQFPDAGQQVVQCHTGPTVQNVQISPQKRIS